MTLCELCLLPCPTFHTVVLAEGVHSFCSEAHADYAFPDAIKWAEAYPSTIDELFPA